jgi:hypothetical protein
MALSTEKKIGFGVIAAVVLAGGGYLLLKKKEEVAPPPGPSTPPPVATKTAQDSGSGAVLVAKKEVLVAKLEDPAQAAAQTAAGITWKGLLPKNGTWGLVGDEYARLVGELLATIDVTTKTPALKALIPAIRWESKASEFKAGATPFFAIETLAKIDVLIEKMKPVDVIVVMFAEESLRIMTGNSGLAVNDVAAALAAHRATVQQIVKKLATAYPNKTILVFLPPWDLAGSPPHAASAGTLQAVPSLDFGGAFAVAAKNVSTAASGMIGEWSFGNLLLRSSKGPAPATIPLLAKQNAPTKYFAEVETVKTAQFMITYSAGVLSDFLFGTSFTKALVA